MTVTGTPAPGTPPDPAPVTTEDVKKLAKSALSNPTGPDSARVKSDVTEKNGFYTFKVGDNFRTYTVSVKKAYIDGLSKQEQQDWGKGLSLQLASMSETGTTNASFNIKDRSITLNNKTFFFSTQAQLNAHKKDYQDLLTEFTTTENALDGSGKEIHEIQKQIDRGGHSKADLQNLKDKLKTAKEDRVKIRLQFRDVEAQVKEMEQVHKISGQLFVKGGIKPEAAPSAEGTHTAITQENETRPVPELPEMGPAVDPSGIVARAPASGTPPPSTYKDPEHLGTDSLAFSSHVEGKTELNARELNDGRTRRVLGFIDSAREGNLPPIDLLQREQPPLTRAEQWALLSGIRGVLNKLKDNDAPTNTIKEFNDYIDQLHDLYHYSKPQFDHDTTVKKPTPAVRQQVVKELVAATKAEIANLNDADINKIKVVVKQLKVAYEGLNRAERAQFYDSMRKISDEDKQKFRLGFAEIDDIHKENPRIKELMNPEEPFGAVMQRLGEEYG